MAMVPFHEMVYLPDEDRYEEATKVPPGARTANISGTQVRDDFLAKGRALPEWFTRPEVAAILARGLPAATSPGRLRLVHRPERRRASRPRPTC